MMDIKGKNIVVLCDTKEKIEKFYGALNIKVDNDSFKCDYPSKLYIGFDEYGDLTWDSCGYFQNHGYKLITFEEFMNGKIEEIKKEDKKMTKERYLRCVKQLGIEKYFTVGKIYTVNDGNFESEYGYNYASKGKSVDDIIKFLNSWYVFEEVSSPSSTYKTITITTSDSTTTLTDGSHTTTINRYYTDKHDEKVAVNEVVKKYYEELARIEREKNRKPTKGGELIGVEIPKGTKFKVVNIEPHRDRSYVCLDEYIGKVGSFAKDSFKFTENGYMDSAIFEDDYLNAIDKKNGGLCWKYDEVEILWED